MDTDSDTKVASSSGSPLRRGIGIALILLGLVVFAIRLQHDGAYAVPRGGNLFGGLGSLTLGGLLLWPGLPRAGSIAAYVAVPLVLYAGLYAIASELEEVVSLYATDSEGRPAELRLWIVDRSDGSWLGMPRSKAVEHSLDGARIDMLRNGERRCVVPVLHDDRETVVAIHQMKLDKYAVARISASVGLYPSVAKDTTVVLRVDPCEGG